MKELAYLNKYLLRYKWQLVLGLVFVIISTFFQIYPAILVRHSIDLVTDNLATYKAFQGTAVEDKFFGVFSSTILFYALLILVMALLRGLFLYFVRQTLIV